MSDEIDKKVDYASGPPAYPAEGYAVYPNAPAVQQQPQPSYPGVMPQEYSQVPQGHPGYPLPQGVMPQGYSQVPQGHPGYPLPQAPATVIVTQPRLGPDPAQFFCPTCNQTVVSNVYYESGVLTWILVFAIFFFGGVFGCCLIPLCCDSSKDAHHSCPLCKRNIGIYKRI